MNHQAAVGTQAPSFVVNTVEQDLTFGQFSLQSVMNQDKWTVLFFYPMDFSIVCPTEITSISDRCTDFEDLDAEIIGISTDSIYTHQAWMQVPREDNGVKDIMYPLGADTNHKTAKAYGVLKEEEGTALRSLFIISPEKEVMYAVVHHHNVGRDVDEILRVLQALQTGRPCPANWKPGDDSL